MSARLASSVLVGALLRRAQAEGGFGAVLAKGDPTAGSLTVILMEKGKKICLLERHLQADGSYSWQAVAKQIIENDEEVDRFLARRGSFDPDMWVIELDIPSAERFTDEMNAVD